MTARAEASSNSSVPVRPGALLFDLDGTLVDSRAAVRRGWARVSQEYDLDLDLDELMRVHAGRPAAATIRAVAPWLDERAVNRVAAAQLSSQYDDLADVVAIDGCEELLDTLAFAGLPWAVVTSGDRRLARARLGAAGVYPPVLVTADDVTEGKPDPQGYLLAARLLSVPPADCVVVEDSAAGVEAGRRAGMCVVGVGGVPADLTVDKLKDVIVLCFPGARGFA
jgi:sugar-phosphatase